MPGTAEAASSGTMISAFFREQQPGDGDTLPLAADEHIVALSTRGVETDPATD